MTIDKLEKRLESTEAALADTQRQLTTLRDIEAIKQLNIRYINAIALGVFDGITDLFSNDAILDLTKPNQPQETNPPLFLRGKENLETFYAEGLSKGHTGQDGVFVVHPLITVSGTTATGSWMLYIMYRSPRTGQSMFWIQSVFEPEYVKEDGEWKFSAIHCAERLGIPGGGTPLELVATEGT